MLTFNYTVILNVILPRHCLTDLIQVPYLYWVIKSLNGSGWKGLYRPSSSKPPAVGRDTFH